MKAIILFASKYGSTQMYSEWLSQETGYPVTNYQDIEITELDVFDRVVVGSSVHMGKIDISSWLKKYWKRLSTKEIILFSVNGTPPDKTNELQNILDYSLPDYIQNHIKYFPLQGRFIYSELNLWHKLLVKMMKRMNKQPANNFVLEDYDNLRKENLDNLKKYLKQTESLKK